MLLYNFKIYLKKKYGLPDSALLREQLFVKRSNVRKPNIPVGLPEASIKIIKIIAKISQTQNVVQTQNL